MSPSQAAGIPRSLRRENPRQGNPRGSQRMQVPTHNPWQRFSAMSCSRARPARAALTTSSGVGSTVCFASSSQHFASRSAAAASTPASTSS